MSKRNYIIGLYAENIKRLSAVDIKVKDNKLILVSGKNNQGKSSVIDSIYMALGGKEAEDKEVLRKGAEKGLIKLETEDFIIHKSFTESGNSYLKITNKEETATFSSPQNMLDKLLGPKGINVLFDPLSFANANPQEQITTLKSLGKFKTDPLKIKEQIKEKIEERKVFNKEHKRYKDLVENMTEPNPNLPTEEIIISQLVKERDAIINYNNELQEKRSNLDMIVENGHNITKKIASLKIELEVLENERTKLKNEYATISAEIHGQETKSLEDVETKIDQAESTNQEIRKMRSYMEVVKLRDEYFEKAEALTGSIEELKSEELKAFEEAELPIENLTFDEEVGVRYDGIPISQLGSALKFRVGLKISYAINPDFRIIISKEGDKLDSDTLKEIEQLSKEYDFQIWLEKINPEGLPAIIIEDGRVKGE